jgi:NitT/TauT family transport system substrate-binding protein
MKREVALGLAGIIVLVMAGPLSWYLTPHASPPEKPEVLTIGLKPAEANALIYIAEDRGFFTENGIQVAIKNYSTKLQSFKGMENGDVDISVISEYPVVGAAFEGANISIIGSTCRYQDQYLVARRDGGIETVSDLQGKKIGVPSGTIGEFYLGRFLDLHGVSPHDVTIKNTPFTQAGDAIFNGSVDAVLIYDGAPRSSETLSENNFSAWSVQSGQPSYDVIACRDDWISGHLEAIRRLLTSLDQAGEYMADHPAEGRAIAQKRVDRSEAQMATIWPRFQFSLILDQSLVLAMEDEGRWMIRNNLTDATTIPDYRYYISQTGLEEIKPESVNIIG